MSLHNWLLTAIIFIPLLGAAVSALLPKSSASSARWVALAATGVTLVASIYALFAFNLHDKTYQFVVNLPWVSQVGIRYHLGVDGISLPMVFLSALLTFLAVIASWKQEKDPKVYFAMMLLLEVGMNGVFCALDFVLFYVFWELVLVPMFFLIANWGGPRRKYASIKFFLYTLAGSVFMLVGILALYITAGSFQLPDLALKGHLIPAGVQWWLFLAFFLGFAVKVPMWPLHTWLPDAHVEAPTAASVLLAGVLLKMGTYGFLRVSLPILPDAAKQWAWFLALLAAISIVYGAAVAFAQSDLKKLVAYSSVSHMGFAMLGIASLTVAGINGAVAVMFSHGLLTGMLFFIVGFIYDRAHTREISKISGLVTATPRLGAMLAFAAIASLGLPGLSGFIGEFLSLLGGWSSAWVPNWLVVISAVGVLLGAAYMLYMIQRVVQGTPSETVEKLTDATGVEMAIVAPLGILAVLVGLYWGALLSFVNPAAETLMFVMGLK